ncbi:MAG: DEAD/DEAH box helicase family protein, partial [Firmicutes bacterium]|nr:DEAD/DEAH box helicase family protein [Bacillota bacterium]
LAIVATPYTLADLRKLAFWNATGSGKTLLMHVNILQYRHYLALHGREKELSRVILLTPNEGLSRQHEEEFALSGLPAQIFSKDGAGLYKGQYIEIIDIHKLKDEMGEKTVAVEAFEGNNLVLVDEGHRGSSGEDWKAKRDKLCAEGFSFEYSATFGQAMKASGKAALIQEYAKCILFDYSYKYFYRDGYGKDYQILNLANDSDDEIRQRYLTACLLTFYQQLRLFKDKQREYAPYLLEKPLLVFVGSKVTAVRSENKRKVSDVVDILLFLN